MVAVGDVERLHRVESAGDRGNAFGIAQHPDLVPDAIIGRDVGRRFAAGDEA